MIVHLREKRSQKDVFLRVRDAVLVVESRWLKAERVEPLTFASRAEALADAERRLHKWLVRGRFEVVTRHDDDAWLRRMHRAERVARRIAQETNAAADVQAEGAAYWSAPVTESWLVETEEKLGFPLPDAARGLLETGTFVASASVACRGNRMSTSIQVGNVVAYEVDEVSVRGVDGIVPPVQAQLEYRGRALHMGWLPLIGGARGGNGAFLLRDGRVMLVEHGLEVERFSAVEAFAEHALNVFEEAADGALDWVQR